MASDARGKWHFDEVVIAIRGRKHGLGRAVNADSQVLDILVQARRNARAARRFLKVLIERFGAPCVIFPDKLRSYIKPIRELAPGADRRTHRGSNNCIEGSHRPTRKHEKLMGRFKSPRQAQRFLVAHDQVYPIFKPRRYRLFATSYHQARSDSQELWVAYALEMTA